jgi:putative ABC transport system permease protein
MLAITLNDLRHRARQFTIAVVGAGLLFAMGLLLSGLANGFAVEIHDTVVGLGTNSFVVAKGAPGRLAALPPIPAASVYAVAAEPGVRQVEPLVITPSTVVEGNSVTNVVLVGRLPGTDSALVLHGGRHVADNGEAVVDERLGLSLGQRFSVSGRQFRVVGLVEGQTLLGGLPEVDMTLDDAQAVAFRGAPLVSTVATVGRPTSLPSGLTTFSAAGIERSSLAGVKTAVSSIDNSRSFAWFVAAIIVAALVYVTALQRTRDFAVLKALGCSSGRLFVGLASQAVLITLAAALFGIVLSNFMKGIFDQPVVVPASAYVALPTAAVIVGLLASLIALRRAVAVDPVMAFAGA